MSNLLTGARIELYTSVLPYYTRLLEDLNRAEGRVSLIYHAFVHGEWSNKFADAMIARAQAGVRVRLMTDGFGIFLEKRRFFLRNLKLFEKLREGGVRVDIFNPSDRRLTSVNRLHIKLCAIDDQIAFIGGSNIADHYLLWDDTNLRLQTPSMQSLHHVYDEMLDLSTRKSPEKSASTDNGPLHPSIKLTVPRRKKHIRDALLELIEEADQAIYIRTWCFFPDRQVMRSLMHKARSGVEVHVLLSHQTRVRPFDYINRPKCRSIAKAGGRVYRFTDRYMHAKIAWSNKGDVILGSANIDYTGMNSNFECSLALRNPWLRDQLQEQFNEDTSGCIQPYAQC